MESQQECGRNKFKQDLEEEDNDEIEGKDMTALKYKLSIIIYANVILSNLIVCAEEEEINYIYVGDGSPLWCCKNAMDTNHKCCYCLCNKCHINQDEGHRTKRNCNENAKDCDHKTLEVETRSSYFNPYYLRNCQVDRKYTPNRCSECLKMLTDMKNMVAL